MWQNSSRDNRELNSTVKKIQPKGETKIKFLPQETLNRPGNGQR